MHGEGLLLVPTGRGPVASVVAVPDADQMPDPDEHTPRAEVYSKLYRDVLVAQRAALIAELDAGNIEDEAARAMLERLDLQEAGVTARLESRF